jgi:hypothetical protein
MSQITSAFVDRTHLVCIIGFMSGKAPRSASKDRNQMVEVFKTDVEKQSQANLLINLICIGFTGYQATFDLEDCDKILRIASSGQPVCCESIIELLESFGYQAVILEEEIALALQVSTTEFNQY